MESIRRAAVDGFNETLNGIKKAQETYADTQEHYVSLIAFCSCNTEKIFDKVPAVEARPLELKDYCPCCCTPLYDAIGFSVADMQRHVKNIDDVVVTVTIITDGYENASKEFSRQAIKTLVESLKGNGWTFTFMGANQDAALTAETLAIRNSTSFNADAAGMDKAYRRDRRSKMALWSKLNTAFHMKACMSKDESLSLNSNLADEAFDETEDEDLV